MEIIYLILMFLAPGLVVKMIDKVESISNDRKNKTATIYEQLFWIVAHSVIISAISIFLIGIIHFIMGVAFPDTLSAFIIALDRWDICTSYILVMLSVTVFFKKVFLNIILKPLWFNLHNKQLKENYGVKKESPNNTTVWENIFLNRKDKSAPIIATIYKDGTYITSGIIHGRNANMNEPQEYRLVRTSEIERVLIADLSREIEDRWLDYVDFEYFDSNSGILIKFYDPQKVLEHWNEI